MESERATKRLYFGYASNMDSAQMRERCPDSEFYGAARLSGYRFIITDRGYANVVQEPGREAHGVLWLLSATDERSLDLAEGTRAGFYRQRKVDVVPGCGEPVFAFLYVADSSDEGPPVPGYLEQVVGGAREHGLPPEYIEELESWGREGSR